MPSIVADIKNAIYVLTTSPTPHLPEDYRFPSDESFADYCAGYWMALVTALRAINAAVERRRVRDESLRGEHLHSVKPTKMARATLAQRKKVS